jgi:hypothetical protein
MPEDPHDSVCRKVEALFTELAGDRARMLCGSLFPSGITSTITVSLTDPDATDEQVLRADKIAFDLTDWNADAAFLVALHLYPERFTPEEIEAGVGLFLCHVPSHVFAAARLAGQPVEDLFRNDDSKA